MGKRKKASKKKYILEAFLLFLVVVVCGFFGLNFYTTYVNENEKIDDLIADLREQIPIEATDDLNLPTHFPNHEKITLVWESSKPSVITNSGQLNQPSFLDGDLVITLTVRFFILKDNGLAQLTYDLLGLEVKEVNFKVRVLKRAATTEEKISYALNNIYIPEKSAVDIGLIKEMALFEDLEIVWESLNPNIINDIGEVVNPGEATLKATIKVDSQEREILFLIVILDEEFLIEDFFETFDGITTGTYGEDWTRSNIIFHQAIVTPITTGSENRICRIRANNQGFITINKDIINANKISFIYRFFPTDSHKINMPTHLNLYYSIDEGETWISFHQKLINKPEWENLEVLVPSINQPMRFKIEFVSEYVTDLRIDIDDLLIERGVIESDIKNWLENYLDTKTSRSIVLPKTSLFGGVISWSTSNSQIITDKGLITRTEQSQTANLTAIIDGFSSVFEVEIAITVFGILTVESLEIYFIDLGKYGSSDTGEAIYIRIGSIDILVDAGDNHSTSKQAIKEVLNAKVNDGIIEYVIATHPCSDHIGGIPEIFNNYQVNHLLQFHGTHTTNIYNNYVNSYKAANLISECTALDAINNVNGCKSNIEITDDISIKIVDTGHYEDSESNGRSIVFVLEAYGTRVLFTGDADNAYGRKLESYYMHSVGDVDILKVVHHGSKHGTSLEYLRVIKPEVVIITNGNFLGNKHGHPASEVINRIYEYSIYAKIYAVTGGDGHNCEVKSSGSYQCTPNDRFVDRNGTILITIDNTGYYIGSEYHNEPIELSQTHFWQTHPQKLYSYGG